MSPTDRLNAEHSGAAKHGRRTTGPRPKKETSALASQVDFEQAELGFDAAAETPPGTAEDADPSQAPVTTASNEREEREETEDWALVDAVRRRREKEGAAPRRTRKGFAAASLSGASALRRVAGRRGVAEARLLTHWREIAGPVFGDASSPIRVKPRGGHALGGVLVLAVDGPRASELEHAAPQLIERVNAFYGYAAVAEVKLTQAATRAVPPPRIERPKPVALSDLSESKQRTLLKMTQTVADDDLRGALARLGANVMVRAARKDASATQ